MCDCNVVTPTNTLCNTHRHALSFSLSLFLSFSLSLFLSFSLSLSLSFSLSLSLSLALSLSRSLALSLSLSLFACVRTNRQWLKTSSVKSNSISICMYTYQIPFCFSGCRVFMICTECRGSRMVCPKTTNRELGTTNGHGGGEWASLSCLCLLTLPRTSVTPFECVSL